MLIPSFKKNNLMTVAYYTKFIPVIYEGFKGFEADLLKAIAKLWDIEIHSVPFDEYKNISRKINEPNSIFDVVAAGFDPSCREGNCLYTNPTCDYSQSLLIKRIDFKNKKITGYTSFKNTSLKIGVLGNSTGEKYAVKRLHEIDLDKKVLKYFDDEKELLLALENDEIQGIARGTIGNEYQEFIDKTFITIEKKSFGETMAFLIDASNPLLEVAMNNAIDLITESGKISYPAWFENPQIFNSKLNQLHAK